ncbi:hypothetical protein HK102_002918 [Quaeritorhiza haematococci]|nr:hypothetical protein HK102_002918 [Quaeritorhiza haematococci]
MRRLTVVTGANRGIGFEICRQLYLTHKHDVLLAARDLAKAEQAVTHIRSERDSKTRQVGKESHDDQPGLEKKGLEENVIRSVQLDTADVESVKAFIRELRAVYTKGFGSASDASSTRQQPHLPPFLTFINNAGVYNRPWNDTMLTNVRGPITLSQAVFQMVHEAFSSTKTKKESPKAPSQHVARIINVTSGLGGEWNVSSAVREKARKIVESVFLENKGLETEPQTTVSTQATPPFPLQESAALDSIVTWAEEMAASGTAGVGGSTSPPYNISKYLLNWATEVTAETGRRCGISVCSVDPGWCATDMGGPSAPRSIEQGANTITWLSTSVKAAIEDDHGGEGGGGEQAGNKGVGEVGEAWKQNGKLFFDRAERSWRN